MQQINTNQNSLLQEALASHNLQFLPLEQITRTILTTEEAAHYLNRKSQTLRCWAMRGDPIAPVRINSRLGWRVADIRKLLNGGAV